MYDFSDIFDQGGPLARSYPGFRPRASQRAMADRVSACIEHRGKLVVEAGTGTGKTFAYLVPALLSGARILISTGTRTLQDQLFSKDVPLLAAALGRPARIALLKGRGNYLCLQRFATAAAPARDRMLPRVREWARSTRRGDLAEIEGLADTHPLWPQLTSTRDNCYGQRCPEIARCHVAAARREAQEADIVIVNHHLLLADLVLKEDGFGDLLGAADAVILDEAHQIPDLAAQFFGATLSERQLSHFFDDLTRASITLGPRWPALAEAMAHAQEGVRALASELPARAGRSAWADVGHTLPSAVLALAGAIHELSEGLERLPAPEGPAPELEQARERAAKLADTLDRLGDESIEGVRTAELGPRGFSLQLSPYDVSGRFRALLDARQSAWIFTSATLSVGEDFSHFTSRLGLSDAETLQIASPFDYERQSVLYLPPNLPDPTAANFIDAVMELSLSLIEASRGGAFILFTSHRGLSRGAQFLRAHWQGEAPYPLFVQGDAPREQLLRAFRASGSGVLLGTASFWEGVDVKGSALRLVVIEKLPFASPDDPIVRAHIERIQQTGGNAFRDYQLPQAALALKQGVGRLIRSEEDFGAVAICDRRIVEKSYGRALRAALPPMSVTRDASEVRRFLVRHSGAA